MKKKKRLSLLLVMVLLIGSLAGCTSNAPAGEEPAPKAEKQFVAIVTGSTGGTYYPVGTILATLWSEKLGDQGDVLLADFSQYLIGLRSEMRIDLSQHLYFTTDEGAARLIERHDGQPLWDSALTLEDGSTEVSPFITLAAR